MPQEQSEKADKRDRTHDQRTRANLRQVLGLESLHKRARQKAGNRPHFKPFSSLDFKNILGFCLVWSPKIPRKHQSTPNKNLFLPLFALFVWKSATMEGRKEDSESIRKAGTRQGANEGTEDKRESGYMESIRKRDTPPICGATSALYPHNFSHQKSRKKFAPRKHNFSHQKYRKKSPWSDWKKFRKKFVGKCFGERKAPNLVERGRGAKIWKISAKIVELFGIARWQFFHFVFVP